MSSNWCQRARGSDYNFDTSGLQEEECKGLVAQCSQKTVNSSTDIWSMGTDGTVGDFTGAQGLRNNPDYTGPGSDKAALIYKTTNAEFTESPKKYIAYTHHVDGKTYSAVAKGTLMPGAELKFNNFELLYYDKQVIDTNVFLKNIANQRNLVGNDDIQPSFTPPRVPGHRKKAEFVSADEGISYRILFSSTDSTETYGHDTAHAWAVLFNHQICVTSCTGAPYRHETSVSASGTFSPVTPITLVDGANTVEEELVKSRINQESTVKILGHSDQSLIDFNFSLSRKSANSSGRIYIKFFYKSAEAGSAFKPSSHRYLWLFEDMGPNEQQITKLSNTSMKANFHAQYGIDNVNVDSRNLGDIFEDELVQVYTLDGALEPSANPTKIHLVCKQKRKLKVVSAETIYSSVPILPGKFNKPKYFEGQRMYKDDEAPKVWRNYWREVYTSTNEYSVTDVAKWDPVGQGDNPTPGWALNNADNDAYTKGRRSIKYFVINSFDEINSAKIASALTNAASSATDSDKSNLSKLSFDKFGNITIYGEKNVSTGGRGNSSIKFESPFGFVDYNENTDGIKCTGSNCEINRYIFYRNPLYAKYFSSPAQASAVASQDILKFNNTQEIHVYAANADQVGNSGLEVATDKGHDSSKNIKDDYLQQSNTGFPDNVQYWYTGDKDCIVQVEGKYILKRLEHYKQWRKEYLGILVSRLNKITKTVRRNVDGTLYPINTWVNVTQSDIDKYKRYKNLFKALKTKETQETTKPIGYSDAYPGAAGTGFWNDLNPDKVPLYELLYNPIHHSQFKKYYDALLIENKVLDIVDSVKNTRSKNVDTNYSNHILYDSSKTDNTVDNRDFSNIMQNYCNSLVNKEKKNETFYNPITYTKDNFTVYEKYADYSCLLSGANLHLSYSTLLGQNYTYNTLMYKKFSQSYIDRKFEDKQRTFTDSTTELTDAHKQEVMNNLLNNKNDHDWVAMARNHLDQIFKIGMECDTSIENCDLTQLSDYDTGEMIITPLCAKDDPNKYEYGPGYFISNSFGSNSGPSDSFIQQMFSTAIAENDGLQNDTTRRCHIYDSGNMAECLKMPSINIRVTCKTVIGSGNNTVVSNSTFINNCPQTVDLSKNYITEVTQVINVGPPLLRVVVDANNIPIGAREIEVGSTEKSYYRLYTGEGTYKTLSDLLVDPDRTPLNSDINGVTIQCLNNDNNAWGKCHELQVIYNGNNLDGTMLTDADFDNQPSNGIEVIFRARQNNQTDRTLWRETSKRIKLTKIQNQVAGIVCQSFVNYNCPQANRDDLLSRGYNTITRMVNGVQEERFETDTEKITRESQYQDDLNRSNRMRSKGCYVDDSIPPVNQIYTFTETEAECDQRIADSTPVDPGDTPIDIENRKILNGCKRYQNGTLIGGTKMCDVNGYLVAGCSIYGYSNYDPGYVLTDNTLCANITDSDFVKLNKDNTQSTTGEPILTQDELKFVINMNNNYQHDKHAQAMTVATTGSSNTDYLTLQQFQIYKNTLNLFGGYRVLESSAPCGIDSVFINNFNSNNGLTLTLPSDCNVQTNPPVVNPPNTGGGTNPSTGTAANRYYGAYNLGDVIRCYNTTDNSMCIVSIDPNDSSLKTGNSFQHDSNRRVCIINGIYKYYDELQASEKPSCTASYGFVDGEVVNYWGLYKWYDKNLLNNKIYCDASGPGGLQYAPQSDLENCEHRPDTDCSKNTCDAVCLGEDPNKPNIRIRSKTQCQTYMCNIDTSKCTDAQLAERTPLTNQNEDEDDNTFLFLIIGVVFLILIIIMLFVFL